MMGCGASEPIHQDYSLPGHSRVVYSTSRRQIRPTYYENEAPSYSETSRAPYSETSRAYAGSNSRSYEKRSDRSPSSGQITRADLARHAKKESCWISIDGKVFDVTNFLPHHPGGVENLLFNGGRDATNIFYASHGPHVTTNQLVFIGRLVN